MNVKKILWLSAICTLLSACSSSANKGDLYWVTQANESAITIKTHLGGYSDKGISLAAKHCGQFGKVAVYEAKSGSGFTQYFTYLCK